MAILRLALIIIFCLLQYRLWFGENSLSDYVLLNEKLSQVKAENAALLQRNKLMKADIDDLRLGSESIEERARNELGLIREGEIFYRIIPTK
ncbi:cell division protein FtsB [Catenovulum sp. SM1970]|uniref:cell division protein FtsB n=1 Tax=Marinifaba aquimaris TaxID=2741323 RepID=UPI001574EC97|nr:cell division protein FtsB [Marinifaba aquimaris]